jgi:long-subunit acyl-CoA synthetase (AMP-forming)
MLTGDLGDLDADGYLSVTGRKTNKIINAYGRNISPEWVEGELAAQPEIAQAIVFGEAKPALGAIITPTAPSIDEKRIAQGVARANANLPEYARVARWRLAPPFTAENGHLTANGRLRRDKLLADHDDFVSRDG